MARYIDADKFIAELEQEKTAALEFEDGVAVYEIEHTMNLIGMQPTADVVPRAEAENYKSIAETQQKLSMDRYFEIKQLKQELDKAKGKVKRCKDCVYFQPDFVLTNDGERRPYTQEEKNSTLGMVTGDVGINCGSRCERFDYWADNRFPVWFQENDYCSYFKKKYTEEKG